ncbi:MAG: ABC transporter ATP-binding protein/permease [Oscillospiraceae bacterium]|nr:ABC transporter ATP-binding protein/permease [Oscillospiraceae bacterium]
MLRQAVRSVAVILKYARIPTVLTLILRFAQSFEAPLSIFFTGKLVNSIGFYIKGDILISEIIKWAVLLIAIMLISANSGLFLGLAEIFTHKTLNKNFTGVVLEKFRRLDYSCFEDPDVLNTLERMGSEPHLRIYYLYNNTISAISTFISLLATAVVFTQVSVWFAVVYFILLAPILWFNYKSIEARQRLWNTEMPNWRRRTYLSALLADKHAEFELKTFGAVKFILSKWRKIADDFRREYVNMRIKSSKYGIFHVITLAVWAVFVILSMIYGLLDETNQAVNIGVFVACITSIGAILNSSSVMSGAFSQVSQDCLEMKHYDIFMSLPEVAPDIITTEFTPIQNPHIIFDNVYFSYPKTDKNVLNGATFEIFPGERVALVGENGAGKSTIVKLLCGLYKPNSGDIYINDVSINQIPASQLRQVFSVVFQDFCGYELTLRENVAFGNINKINDDEAIKKALKDGLLTEIETQELSIDSNLGKLEDDGTDLSGGQWQKVAVSRTLLSDGAFVILDEPTASLDPVAESKMYETFQSVLQKRGCVMISHRLASAKLADKIIVLNNGAVTQTGTHSELMSQGGLYRDMFTAQSAWYVTGGDKTDNG